MDNGIYIALSRQMALFRDLEVSANNLANATSPGFNAQKIVFSDYLTKDQKRKDAYANDVSNYRDVSKGAIRMTDNPFDLAITGPGYFSVETPYGTRYTKSGNFQVDSIGTLMTTQGYPVLGNDLGRIFIPANARNVIINGAGQISAEGNEIGQVGMVEFKEEQKMERMGDLLYRAKEEPNVAEKSRMLQGGLENSNVNAVAELIRVQEVSRSVGSTAKFVETMYDLQRKVSSVYSKST
ncbi:MAG: flagellar hook-basal body complex protein [Rickettsiales bacterium]